MPLRITTMTESFADQIMLWNYEPPYDFYNSEPDEEFRKELLECSYYAILDEEGQLFRLLLHRLISPNSDCDPVRCI